MRILKNKIELDSLNEECSNKLLDLYKGYMSFMGFSHLAVLTMTIPSGLLAYIQWMNMRQRSKDVESTEKVTHEVLQMSHRQSIASRLETTTTGHLPLAEAPTVIEEIK
jgi:hypothetical protein